MATIITQETIAGILYVDPVTGAYTNTVEVSFFFKQVIIFLELPPFFIVVKLDNCKMAPVKPNFKLIASAMTEPTSKCTAQCM